MGKNFLISEEEKNNIKSLYGLVNEQQCSLTQSDINSIIQTVIEYFSPQVLSDDIDLITDGFKEQIKSDLVLKIWDSKIEELKSQLKPTFDKYLSDVVYATFFGGTFDVNAYLYEMLNKLFAPIISEYDNSLIYKGAAKAAVTKDNLNYIKQRTHSVYLELVFRFYKSFTYTIKTVPSYAIKVSKNLKKCDVKSNPNPFTATPNIKDFENGNRWITSTIQDRLTNAA